MLDFAWAADEHKGRGRFILRRGWQLDHAFDRPFFGFRGLTEYFKASGIDKRINM